jgi:hypothetical protein
LRFEHVRPPLCALLFLGVVATGLAAALGHASAAPIVGNAATVFREVRGQLETINRVLVVDSEVSQDEEVTTGPGSATRILFKDGTNLEIGENSRLKLTKLVFDADPNKSKLAVKAMIGVFRWTSGTLPSSAYSIATPVATIGIRGTTLEFIVGDGGLTTVALTRGEVVVSNLHGDSVTLHPGDATTVLPPDPDGSQAPPSTPGELSASARDQILKMTRTVRVNEVTGIIPGAGDDGSGSSTSGGSNVQAGLPSGASPPRGPGNGGSPSNEGSNPGPPNPPIVTFPPVPPILASTGVGKTTGNGKTTGSGSTTSSGAPPGSAPTTPRPVVKTDMGTIGWQLVVDGATRTAELKIPVPSGGSVTLVSVTQNGAEQQFAITDIALNAALTGDASGNALVGFLNFEPLPGDVGFFSGDISFEDALGDSWIWHYTGSAEAATVIDAVPEPPTLLVLGAALLGLLVMRRRSLR